MITAAEFDAMLVNALPELAADRSAYERRQIEDPEFVQSFFSYSFVPTLQAAIDRNVEDFCTRAFAMIEGMLREGDPEVQVILHDEFFDYGPVCQKWMQRVGSRMGPLTRKAATGK